MKIFFVLLIASFAVVAQAIELILPENPVMKLTALSNVKLTGARAPTKTHLRSKAVSGYVVTKIFSGATCDKEAMLVQGIETNACLIAVDRDHNPVGSAIYELSNLKMTTSEYSTLDCTGTPLSSTTSLLPVNRCFTNAETGTSATAEYVETAEPWTMNGKGMNWLLYDRENTCESSPQYPSIFNWIPFSYCYPATIGENNTPGGLQYTSCSDNTYTMIGYSDVSCTEVFHTYEVPRPVCIVNDYGSADDDDTNETHLDAYETLSCNM